MNYTDIIKNIIENINSLGYEQNDYQRFEDEYGWASWMEDYCEGEDPTENEIEEINNVLKDAWRRAFSNNLHRIRKDAGLTQKQLSEASGVHINIISRIERGERSSDKLTLDTAAKLAKALNCHAEDLLD